MKANYYSESIWTIDNFISSGECDNLIFLSEQQGYEEAKVSLPGGAKMLKGLRNNYRLMHQDLVLADSYWKKLAEFCPPRLETSEAVGLNPLFRFYKYSSSQRFKRHIDGRFKSGDLIESRITFMVYLNDDFEGGETQFDSVIITPEKGTALCFIHEQKHEGCPVNNGTKYVIRTDVLYKSSSSQSD
jgi:hypothetical protein